MAQASEHPLDEELIQALDGECSRSTARKVDAHLADCWLCRVRMGELEATLHDFVSEQRQALPSELPDIRGRAAMLRARLAEAGGTPPVAAAAFPSSPLLRSFGWIAALLLVAVLGCTLLFLPSRRQVPAEGMVAVRTTPDQRLTPGATRPIELGEVCAMRHEEVVRDVPGDLRDEVFREYGIAHPQAGEYEVDYLIAPGLGGTDNIRNLWPEPAGSSAWNAHRKDVLEERLHQLVCDGDVDLLSAQRSIATNWIAAYEKYCLSADHRERDAVLGKLHTVDVSAVATEPLGPEGPI